jgi:hypothetical protein
VIQCRVVDKTNGVYDCNNFHGTNKQRHSYINFKQTV